MTTSRFVLVAAATALLGGCNSDAPKPVAPQATAAVVPAGPPPAAAHASPTPSEPPAALPPGHPQLPDSSLPPGHPPIGSGPGFAVAPPAPGAGAGAAALHWTVPRGWVSVPPASSMRRAQYKVPGPSGDAECVVFYFGPGQGGDAKSNAARWASQFRPAGGKGGPAAMTTRELQVGAVNVLIVEVAGTYVGGMGGEAGERPGYRLLGAIAQGADANWFFKLTGPDQTVAAQRAAFEEMIRSLGKGA